MISVFKRPKRRPHLLSCIGTDWDVNLPEHFIRHYLKLGIRPRDFVIALHTHTRNFLEPTLKTFREYGIEPRTIWRGPFDSRTAGDIKRKLQREFIPRRHWIVHADLDEFQEYPVPLMDYLDEREGLGENVVGSVFIDRVTIDGSLPAIQHISDGSIFDQFQRCADVVGNVKKGCTYKNAAFRAYFQVTGANHKLERPRRTLLHPIRKRKRPWRRRELESLSFEERLRLDVRVHHFAWSGDQVEKSRVRLKHYRALGYSWFDQSQRVLDAMGDDGRLRLTSFQP